MMFGQLWGDMAVEGLGTPAVDAVAEDTFGTASGTGLQYVGSIDPPDNASAYTAGMLQEMVRRLFRRKDVFISERLAVLEYPLLGSFSDTAGPEAIRPMVLSVPPQPVLLGKAVVLNTDDDMVHDFVTVEALCRSNVQLQLGMRLKLSNGALTPLVTKTLVPNEDKILRFTIPTGYSGQRMQQIRISVHTMPQVTSELRLSRVSLMYAGSALPAPVLA